MTDLLLNVIRIDSFYKNDKVLIEILSLTPFYVNCYSDYKSLVSTIPEVSINFESITIGKFSNVLTIRLVVTFFIQSVISLVWIVPWLVATYLHFVYNKIIYLIDTLHVHMGVHDSHLFKTSANNRPLERNSFAQTSSFDNNGLFFFFNSKNKYSFFYRIRMQTCILFFLEWMTGDCC